MKTLKTIVVVHGLSGSGKTTFAQLLLSIIGGAYINADQVRASISRDLKFTPADRRAQAYRMGKLAALALEDLHTNGCMFIEPGTTAHFNKTVIVDFVSPTRQTRNIFDVAAISAHNYSNTRLLDVWMNTIGREDCRYPDTAAIYEHPHHTTQEVRGYQTVDQMRTIAQKFSAQYSLPPVIQDASTKTNPI